MNRLLKLSMLVSLLLLPLNLFGMGFGCVVPSVSFNAGITPFSTHIIPAQIPATLQSMFSFNPLTHLIKLSSVHLNNNTHKSVSQTPPFLKSNSWYLNNARYYDPIGTFLTPDIYIQNLYDPQSLNRYAYCRNNPIIYTDPSGHIFGIDDAIIIITAAVIGGVKEGTHNFSGTWDWNAAGRGALQWGAAAAAVCGAAWFAENSGLLNMSSYNLQAVFQVGGQTIASIGTNGWQALSWSAPWAGAAAGANSAIKMLSHSKFESAGKLTLYSDAQESKYGSVKFGSHSWLLYKDAKTGDETTWGTWQNLGMQENYRNEFTGRNKTYALCIDITQRQFNIMMSKISEYGKAGATAWKAWTPCSSFASDVFAETTGIVLEDRHWGGLGYSDPAILKEKELRISGSELPRYVNITKQAVSKAIKSGEEIVKKENIKLAN